MPQRKHTPGDALPDPRPEKKTPNTGNLVSVPLALRKYAGKEDGDAYPDPKKQ